MDEQAQQVKDPMVYFLLDGAMMNDVRTHLPTSLPIPGWLHQLAGDDDPAAGLGPILVDAQAALKAGQLELAHALCRTLPSRLHASYVHSHLAVGSLTEHLRQFTKIWLEDGKAYALRFSDCRVLPVLSTVLSAGQWRVLTAPMVQWEIHLREGTRKDLQLGDAGEAPTATPLMLSFAQMGSCFDAQEPDILLRRLGYTLESMTGNIHGYWNLARQCTDLWRKSGSGDRQVLFDFGKKIFESKGKALQQRDWATFLKTATAVDIAAVQVK